MGSSYHFYSCIHSLFAVSFFHLLIITNSSSSKPTCHDHERYALLYFKRSFSIRENIFRNPATYSKVNSWRIQENTSDCCSWNGVECDENSGHVIGLDLSSSLLYGSINSNSSLFRLVHLQRLNLADNDFNYSSIPFGIARLSQLTRLNLSRSAFSGQIPQEISHLSNLVSLDLSDNVKFWSSEGIVVDNPLSDISPRLSNGLLKLETPNLRNLVQNLSNLETLCLQLVNISSKIPDILGNMSSLTLLVLRGCGLYGNVSMDIFLLPNMETLSLEYNENLLGYLPNSIGNLFSLKILDLSWCDFNGSLPPSLGNLTQFTYLDLFGNRFEGDVPFLGNLKQLEFLYLADNKFNIGSLNWVGSLTKLTQLQMSQSGAQGVIPLSFTNLTQLTALNLKKNNLEGQIPSWIANLTRLVVFYIYDNNFQGPIPKSLFNLENLKLLHLADNNLIGQVDLDYFLKIKSLSYLSLSNNELTVTTSIITNKTLPVFKLLDLAACNLMEFPDFLQSQDQLVGLVLGENNIHGQVPQWLLNKSKETLTYLALDYNFITEFEGSPLDLPWTSLQTLHLEFNKLQGPMLISPPSLMEYVASNNKLNGEIPALLCHRNNIQILDLSNNNLSGIIPPCFGNFNNLSVLNLHGNYFHGKLTETFNNGCKLRFIDLSENQLKGKVPRSLANCTLLEILILGNNDIDDIFPFWLGDLSRLQSWNAMQFIDQKLFVYMQTMVTLNLNFTLMGDNYIYSMTLIMDGRKTVLNKILNIFVSIDLSGNKFTGMIPESIGNLKALQLLNLSNNSLSGGIPSSMVSLSNLESLDLSQNNLSGCIPPQLQRLNFLAFLNVSCNHLVRPIPLGEQFDRFENNSYEDNPGLCGTPLSKKCGNSEALSPPISPSEQAKESKFRDKFEWIFISLGYGSGLVVGVVIGNTVFMSYRGWFLEKLGIRQHKRRPRRRQRQSRIVV